MGGREKRGKIEMKGVGELKKKRDREIKNDNRADQKKRGNGGENIGC